MTICARNKECLFGSVSIGNVALSQIGEIVRETWLGLPRRFTRIELLEFVVMPNHMHGLLGFVGAGLAPPGVSTSGMTVAESDQRPSLSDVICAFKSLSMLETQRRLGRRGPSFWQRGYYEHVVRDGEDLRRVERYILENPARWERR